MKWLIAFCLLSTTACAQQTIRIAYDSLHLQNDDTLLYQHGDNANGEIKFRSSRGTTKYIYTSGKFVKKIGYYANNNKMVEYELDEGRLNGAFKKWTRKGNLMVTGFYRNGMADSLWVFYDGLGRKESEGYFSPSPEVLITDFELVNKTLEPAEKQVYPRFSAPDGRWQFYSPDGTVYKTMIFRQGVITHLEVGAP
ncbi:MAG: hypothetical protein U0T84_14260 [Chitinophagales bacterium]